MICSVLVFPVPVAPATSPCRFIIDSGSWIVAPASISPSFIGRPRITHGSSKSYPAAISAVNASSIGG